MKTLLLGIPIVFGMTLFSFFSQRNSSGNPLRYVSLGDSYTYGQGAKSGQSYPEVLTRNLNDNGIKVDLVANPAVSGYTTQDLIDNELTVCKNSKPDFVTLLIGVNDWVRGVDSATYHKNLDYIIDYVENVISDKSKLLLITIPDFGATPNGPIYSEGRNIEEGITTFNNIIKHEAKNRNLQVVDIFPVSMNMKKDLSLVSADGLHPSTEGYATWEKLIYPVAYSMLSKK